MIEKILTQVSKKVDPRRNISIEKIRNRLFIHPHDTTGCNTYLLEGIYSYDEVVKLNALTKFNAGFGFSPDLGPVAFIGIPNRKYAQRSGYFQYKVQEYGTPFDESEYYFKAFEENGGEHIANYTVYGLEGLTEVAKEAVIHKINYNYDSRHKAKQANVPKVFDMDCKLQGTYSYNRARLLATGTLRKKEYFSGEEHPIVFATVGKDYHVGIINMWPDDIDLVRGFRDVWEYGEKEPEIQPIRFLSKKEAIKIPEFNLYIYTYRCSGIGRDKYSIEKYDRTLDSRFDFHIPHGVDYRLIEHTELFR